MVMRYRRKEKKKTRQVNQVVTRSQTAAKSTLNGFAEQLNEALEQISSQLTDNLDTSEDSAPSFQYNMSKSETTNKLVLPADGSKLVKTFKFYEIIAEQLAYPADKKLDDILSALTDSPYLDALMSANLTGKPLSYDLIKAEILKTENRSADQISKFLFTTPNKKDPLTAYRYAKQLTINAEDQTREELLNLIKRHLTEEAYQALLLTDGDLEKQLMSYVSNHRLPTSHTMHKNDDRIERLEKKIEQLCCQLEKVAEVNQVQYRNQPRNQFNVNRSNGQQDPIDRRDRNYGGLCFFHYRFGANAQRCKPFCKLYNQAMPMNSNQSVPINNNQSVPINRPAPATNQAMPQYYPQFVGQPVQMPAPAANNTNTQATSNANGM